LHDVFFTELQGYSQVIHRECYRSVYDSWQWWPVFLMPFALIDGSIAWNIWNEVPAATRAYIEKIEHPPLGQ
jgi:hypothetical protein